MTKNDKILAVYIIVLIVVSACYDSNDGPRAGGHTNWLKCQSLEDCQVSSQAVDCKDGYCVDMAGERIISAVNDLSVDSSVRDNGDHDGGGDGMLAGLGERTFLLESSQGFEPVTGATVRLSFGEGGELGFSAGCNSHSGTVEVRDGYLWVASLRSTEIGCVSELSEQDKWLVQFFISGPAVTVDGDRLTLTGDESKLVFLDREVAGETEGEPPLPVVSLGDCENGSDLMSVITSSDQHGADLSFRAAAVCMSVILAFEGNETATPQVVYASDLYDDAVWSVTHQNQYVPPGELSRIFLNCGDPAPVCIDPCFALFCSGSRCQLSEIFTLQLFEGEDFLWGEHHEIPEEFWPIRALAMGTVDENRTIRLHVIGRGAAYLDGGSWKTVIQPDVTTELRGMIEGLMFGYSGARYRNSDGIWTPDPHPAGVTILDAARGLGGKEAYATKDGLFIGESEIPSVFDPISFVSTASAWEGGALRIGWITADGEIHVGYWNEDRIEICRAGTVNEPVLQFDLSYCQGDTIQFQLLTASALYGKTSCGSRPEQ